MSTKNHTLVDALGNPIHFTLTSGEKHDLVGADHLIPLLKSKILLADKAYHAEERVLGPLSRAGITSVIPAKKNSLKLKAFDKFLYKSRHLIENFFAKLKQYRGIATRYDKTKRNFLAAIYLASSVIWMN